MKKIIKKIAVITIGIISSMIFTPISADAVWKKDDTGWWYTEGNSYVTGWKYIDGNWYYFYSDGYMATDEKIGDYFVNSEGVWTNDITPEDALQLIWNEDKDYITKAIDNGYEFPNYLGECTTYKYSNSWLLPYEEAYEFGFVCADDSFPYLVGKESKDVYSFPN